jgi:predicted enzyme related to lactoylglutathione lyase
MPTCGNGKICYVEIPALDIAHSAQFYGGVFGWKIRQRSNGSIAFDDGVGEVSGAFVLGRPPMREAGLLIYIMVDSVESCVQRVEASGGSIVQPLGVDAPEIPARFIVPAGKVQGLYHQPAAIR